MMEVIIPLRVQTVTPKFRLPYHTSIVQRAFGDHVHAPVESRSLYMHGRGEFFQKVQCGMIQYGVDGIQPEGVEVVVRNPLQRIRNKKMPDVVAIRIVEIQRWPPRRSVALRKIRRELGEVISFRTKVVVDHT